MKYIGVALVFCLFAMRVSSADDEDYSPQMSTESVVGNNPYSDEQSILQNLNISYFGILYGPSLSKPSSYQPDINGMPDRYKPLMFKNFLALGYNISPEYSVAGTAFWTWQPVLKQELAMQDPFIRFSDNMLIHREGLNLYSDLRAHFPVTTPSRQMDMLFGLQTFHSLTYVVGTSRLTLGAYGSARANFYGKHGYGNDVEFYFAPNLNYQLSSSVAFTLLYEMQACHVVGTKVLSLNNEGTDLEPGISWDVTPRINLNPYLNFTTGGHVTLSSTSVGMYFSWVMM